MRTMGVRKEIGPGGMARIVIDRKKSIPSVAMESDPHPQGRRQMIEARRRRPRKSLPVRPQYREFGGRVEKQARRLPVGTIFFVVMLVAYVAFAVLALNIIIPFAIGFAAVGIGVGLYLYPLINRPKAGEVRYGRR